MKKIFEYNHITILSFCFLLCLMIYIFNSQYSSINLEGKKNLEDYNSVTVSVYLKVSP